MSEDALVHDVANPGGDPDLGEESGPRPRLPSNRRERPVSDVHPVARPFEQTSRIAAVTATEDVEETAAPARDRGTLWVLTGSMSGSVHPVGDAETTLGRAYGGDIQLPDPGVSRQHARIVRSSGAFEIEDLGSRNGTFVDGRRVYGRVALTPGARVRLGPNVSLRFDRPRCGSTKPWRKP